jgi:hypothetical protein
MVRAILDGRKTQTRRIVKPQLIPYGDTYGLPTKSGGLVVSGGPVEAGMQGLQYNCPYGQTGDRLWVRETWQRCLCDISTCSGWLYAEKGETPNPGDRWKPSIHMPRAASRITLEIVSVRVERLQDVSEADALAEGFVRLPASGRIVLNKGDQYFGNCWMRARTAFEDLWMEINGKESWGANPWVWVVEFKRVDA